MKKYIEYLLLLAPGLLWWLSSSLLGDHFTLPNRLMLAALCAVTGAAGLLMQRKVPGLIALVAGIGMLASVPMSHDMPVAAFTLRMSDYALPQAMVVDEAQVQAMSQAQSADLVSLKAEPAQAAGIAAAQAQYPFSYTSCEAGGRSFFSRHPISGVAEEQRMGATQVSGELQAGDTAVRFVVLDFSGLQNEAQARTLAQAYLGGEDGAGIALIDTGDSGNRIPLEWITYMTGFAKSQRPLTAFTGNFDGADDDSAQVMLYSPKLRCRAFEESASSMEATFVVN